MAIQRFSICTHIRVLICASIWTNAGRVRYLRLRSFEGEANAARRVAAPESPDGRTPRTDDERRDASPAQSPQSAWGSGSARLARIATRLVVPHECGNLAQGHPEPRLERGVLQRSAAASVAWRDRNVPHRRVRRVAPAACATGESGPRVCQPCRACRALVPCFGANRVFCSRFPFGVSAVDSVGWPVVETWRSGRVPGPPSCIHVSLGAFIGERTKHDARKR